MYIDVFAVEHYSVFVNDCIFGLQLKPQILLLFGDATNRHVQLFRFEAL